MKTTLKLVTLALIATSAIPAFAQGKAAPQKVASAKVAQGAKPKVETGKMSGIVKGTAKDSKFTMGSKTGTYLVDAKGARCTYKGKFYSVNSLKGGDMVSVSGKATGTNVKATEVKVTFVKAAAAGMSKTPKTPTKKGN